MLFLPKNTINKDKIWCVLRKICSLIVKKRIYKSNKYLKIGEKYIAMLFLPKNILKL